MVWFMEISNSEIVEQLLIKYSVIKHLILVKIKNMMDINVYLLQEPINFLIKKFFYKFFDKNENISNKE